MKKLLLLFVSLAITEMFAQSTYVPDDKFEGALIALGYDTMPLDNYVPTANIRNVTNLDISSYFIDDLTGIEDFTGLQVLECRNNKLVNVDLSNNVNLTDVSFENNLITYLDVSDLTNLSYLNVKNNKLRSIDVSKNTNLTDVFISDNPLMKFANLKNGNNSNFTTYRSTNTPNLSCVEVDNASYSSSNWNYRDNANSFSESCKAYVPDDNFEQALIDLGYDSGTLDDYVPITNITEVESLTISNKNIANLIGIAYFFKLHTLDANSNTFTTELNLSNNVNLENLNLELCGLPTLELSLNYKLRTLNIKKNNLSTINLSNNVNLLGFYADHNDLTTIDVSRNIKLQTFSVRGASFTSIDLSKNSVLRSLYLQESDIENLDLSNNKNLRTVALFGCNQLQSLNVKSGWSTDITYFSTIGTSNLSCIQVDDAAYSTNNWTNIDAANTFSENCATASVDDLNLTDFNIYPNPVNEYLTIATNEDVKEVIIYNMQGAEVFTSKTKALNTSMLTSGLYLIKVITKDNKVGVKRFVKK